MKEVSINNYQRLISIYLQRKRDYAKRIDRKLAIWRSGIYRIQKRNERITDLICAVNEYFGVDITSKSLDRKTVFARYCYYKYGLENKVCCGRFLSEAVNKTSCEASKRRIDLTRSFKIDNSKRNKYHDFKNYVDSLK